MAYHVTGGGSLGATVEVSEIEALTKGDLIIGDGVGAPQALTVGTNTFVLTADSAETTGIKWAAAAAGDMVIATYDAAGVSEQLVGLTAIQTLTNKTLTAPAITGGTIENAAIGAVTAAAADFTSVILNDELGFDTGVAATGANYQVLRNADATNLLQLNVPTGASFEFTVNDAAEMTLSATAVDFQNNSITTTGGGSLTGTWSDLGSVTTVDINGGTVDGVTIGAASAGSGTFTGLAASNALSWTAGSAATAANYQILRNADATNFLQLNVPTASGFEFSLNDTPLATLDAGSLALNAKELLLTPATITDSGTDFGIRLTQTLNDTAAPSGAETYTGLSLEYTLTDVTGWNKVTLLDIAVGGTPAMTFASDGTLSITQIGGTPGTDAFGMQHNGQDAVFVNLDSTGGYSFNDSGPSEIFFFDGASVSYVGRQLDNQGADVASANDLTLGADGNVFEITGTTQVNRITNTDWQNGSEVTLLFTSTVTVKDAQASAGATIIILLAGSEDFAAAAGDVLKLVLCEIGGAQAWREVSRSANL
jgi:hypothetical protein